MAEYGFWSQGDLVLTPPLELLVTSMSLSRDCYPQGLLLTWRLRTILASPHFNKQMIHAIQAQGLHTVRVLPLLSCGRNHGLGMQSDMADNLPGPSPYTVVSGQQQQDSTGLCPKEGSCWGGDGSCMQRGLRQSSWGSPGWGR